MATFAAGTIIDLHAREAITLHDVRGTTLRVTRGTVWLTQENDPADVILRVGDNWVVERQGATVLEAQDDTVVCAVGRHVEATREAANAARYDDWRARLDHLLAPYAPWLVRHAANLPRRFVPYY
ncbi:MAG TPA: DUF2917 domain-containing protein [Casimicrobiaceae bacterium]|nr:DUF2917 domain-containing protein [Casimicrobiaceae bacterium]